MFLQRVIPYRLGFARSRITVDAMRSDHAPANKAVRRFLDLLTRRELSRISARRPIRWGGSCFVVAGKREGA
jgi:hypothetical protein